MAPSRLFLTILVSIVPLLCLAQTKDSQNANATRAYQLAETEAKSVEVTRDSKPVQLHKKPLLRWSNPVSGEIYGDVFIWTLDGRPELIGSIYKWFKPYTHMGTELQSLSESSLEMRRDGQLIWKPKPGVEMKRLHDAPAPNANPKTVMRQMRLIAQKFHAEADDRSDSTKTWRLRALRQPIYQYENPNSGITSGAMFAFCQDDTNNPEVLLLIEARKNDEGSNWYYGLGRQNSLRFRAFYDKELNWDVPKLAPPWENPATIMR